MIEWGDITFKEMECLKKLLNTKKLTDKQKEALRKLIAYYWRD